MLKKLKEKFLAVTLACGAWLTVMTTIAMAENGNGGAVKAATAEDVSERIVTVLNDVLMPIGGLVIFVTVVIAAFKIITTANKPGDRAEAMASLPYIVGGGLLLGGAMMASGLIYGLMVELHKTAMVLPMLIG